MRRHHFTPFIPLVLVIILPLWPLTGYAMLQESIEPSPPTVKEKKIYVIRSGSDRVHEVSAWGGYSFYSPNKIWGKTPDAQMGMLGFRYNRKFLKMGQNLLEYVTELNFFANYNFPEFAEDEIVTANRKKSFGFGGSPVGFQLNLISDSRIQPFVKSSAGFLYLTAPFPDTRGVRFNFTLEVGGGLEFMVNRNSSITFGYRYHHMSNGEIGQLNPGIDSNLIYGAITLF